MFTFAIISLIITLFGIASISNLIKKYTGFDLVASWLGVSSISVFVAIAVILVIALIIKRRRKRK